MTEEDIRLIKEELNQAKEHLTNIMHIADGKDGNVIFLAKYRRDDLDTILKCAMIRKNEV